MDLEQKEAVISLFDDLEKRERQKRKSHPNSVELDRAVKIGDTTITGSIVVLCVADQAAGLLASILQQQK